MINSSHNVFGHEAKMMDELKKKLEDDCEISSCIDEVAESFSAIEFDKETIKKIDDLGLYEKHLFELEGRVTIVVMSDMLRGLIYFYNKEILAQSMEENAFSVEKHCLTPENLKNIAENDVFIIGNHDRMFVYRLEYNCSNSELMAKPYFYTGTIGDLSKYKLSQLNCDDQMINELTRDITCGLITNVKYIGNIEDLEKLKNIVLLTEIQQAEERRLSLLKEKNSICSSLDHRLNLIDAHLTGLSVAIMRDVLS